ncbi:MAG: YCF48-related protein, partial [Vicinamibacterales bacterium]|nr:YCF48-related protein [Vicinamibacterales bacterium]
RRLSVSTGSYMSWRRLTRRLGVSALAGSLAFGMSGGAGAAPGAAQRAVLAPLAPTSLLLDVAWPGDRLVAVGERGHVVVSRDGGASWTQSDVPTRALLTGVFMLDGATGWAVGHDEVVLRTRDGGATWDLVHSAPEAEKPLLDVWFANANDGLAVGAYGSLLATRDGGSTWEPRQVLGDDDFHLNHLAAAPDGALYLSAEAGHLYRSDDRGATWQPLASPYDGSFFGILPRRDGTLLAYGLRGHLFRSGDRGATWTAIVTGTEESLTCALELDGGRFVVGGMAGTLLWGDAAASSVRTQELPGRQAIMAIAPVAPDAVLLAGEGGTQRANIPR